MWCFTYTFESRSESSMPVVLLFIRGNLIPVDNYELASDWIVYDSVPGIGSLFSTHKIAIVSYIFHWIVFVSILIMGRDYHYRSQPNVVWEILLMKNTNPQIFKKKIQRNLTKIFRVFLHRATNTPGDQRYNEFKQKYLNNSVTIRGVVTFYEICVGYNRHCY